MVLEKLLNLLFGWIINIGTPWNIIIISFFLSLLVNLAVKFFTDQKLMKSLKEESEHLKKEMQKFKNEPQKLLEMQKKAMESSLKYMKHSMKPTLLTFIPLIIIFGWLGNTFKDQVIITFPFSIPLIGTSLGWLGTYIITSIIFSIILRKLLKIN